jgi:hypothetical protein
MTTEVFILLGLFSWVVLVVLQAFIHYYIIEENNDMPFYLLWNLIRGGASILHGVLFDVQGWSDYYPLLLFQLTTHFAIFAPLLNKLRFKGYWYVGKNSGWIDGWLGSMHVNVYKAIYFSGIVLILVSIWWVFRTFLL